MLSRARSRRVSDFPLAWERLLWSGRPAWLGRLRRREQYHLTDFRAVVRRGDCTVAELAIHDLERVELHETPTQRLRGTSTIILHPKKRLKDSARSPESEAQRRKPTDGFKTPQVRLTASVKAMAVRRSFMRRRKPDTTRGVETASAAGAVVFADIRQGPQLALVLELLATDPMDLEIDGSLVRGALDPWSAQLFGRRRRLLARATTVVLLVALSAAIVARHDVRTPIAYPADDAIYPGGQKRPRVEIVAFMESQVMPFARRVLGPIKGGSDQVTCFTCHGAEAEAWDWRMPAVRALPEPDLRMGGMEHYASIVDAQMRNAVYGYLAEDENQDRAAYMRAVVMPGMARLLHRPPYDFTQTYRYNRARFAFGCYHCHMVSAPERPAGPTFPGFSQTSLR